MPTNNEYLKQIYINSGGDDDGELHSNNYYLKGIAELVCSTTYSTVQCNGKYIKDIVESVTGNTYTGHHFNNYYLHDWAEEASGSPITEVKRDNYLLGVIANNTYNRENALLSWEVPPSNIEYSDFNATGVLTKNGDSTVKIEGANVNLVVGSTVVDSAITDSNGIATFNGSPVHVGTHTFKLVFNGNRYYNGAESSVVQITVRKETSILTDLTYDATVYTDGSLSISGVLKDNDTGKIADATVSVYENSVEIASFTTDSNGEFSGNVTGLTLGSHSLRVSYDGDNDYTATYQDITVSVIDPSISLVGDNPILSYADEQQQQGSQVCTVTATVNSGVDVEDVLMTFTVKKDSTVIDTDTVQVHNNQCEYEYTSRGLGDVTVEAEATVGSRLLIQTFVIEDCAKVISEATFTRDTIGWLSFSEMDDWIVECDFKSTGTRNQRFIVHTRTSASYNELGIGYSYGSRALQVYIGSASGTETYYGNTVPAVANQYYHFKIEKHSNNTAIVSIDDVEYFNASISSISESERKITIYVSDSATNTVKNLKIKPL